MCCATLCHAVQVRNWHPDADRTPNGFYKNLSVVKPASASLAQQQQDATAAAAKVATGAPALPAAAAAGAPKAAALQASGEGGAVAPTAAAGAAAAPPAGSSDGGGGGSIFAEVFGQLSELRGGTGGTADSSRAPEDAGGDARRGGQ